MLPKVILHNSISLDGSLTGFDVNMGLHYRLAATYKPQAHLIGSNTLKTGIESYGNGVPPEQNGDFSRAEKDPSLPYWVVPDTSGKLIGVLHAFRQFEFCKDVIVLVSDITPKEYLRYLDERAYDYHVVGREQADLKESLVLLIQKYNVNTVLVDAGKILTNLLMEQGLVNEISLLVHPVIVGKGSYTMLAEIGDMRNLELLKCEIFDERYVWLAYRT